MSKRKEKPKIPTVVECISSKNRMELTEGKLYEVIELVKDSKGVLYYKIISDKNLKRHYEFHRFKTICEK